MRPKPRSNGELVIGIESIAVQGGNSYLYFKVDQYREDGHSYTAPGNNMITVISEIVDNNFPYRGVG